MKNSALMRGKELEDYIGELENKVKINLKTLYLTNKE